MQAAIAQYTTEQVFKSIDVQSYVQAALPPRADFLAPQLTNQLKTQAQSTLQTILASSSFQQYWYNSLAKSHQALITTGKAYQGNGTITVGNVFNHLSQQLAGTKLSFLSRVSLPPKVGSIKVATVGWLPLLHKLSTRINFYKAVIGFLFLGFVALAIGLARRRRRIIIRMSVIFAAAMLLTLISVKIAGGLIANHANPTYQSAVQAAYNTVLHGFVNQTVVLMIIAVLIVIVGWLSGPYKIAVIIRRKTSALVATGQTQYRKHFAK